MNMHDQSKPRREKWFHVAMKGDLANELMEYINEVMDTNTTGESQIIFTEYCKDKPYEIKIQDNLNVNIF